MKELNDYCCLFVTFQQGISFESKKEFWTSFRDQLARNHIDINIPFISSSNDFANFLKVENMKQLFKNKKVLIFIDEFDLLYYSKDESIIDDVLNIFRGINQTKNTSSLHSLIAIGPFSILELIGRSSSPFNIHHAIRSPNYNQLDVIELFSQVKEDYGNIFDDRIPIDIFQRTSGHRGLTDLCGKCLHEVLLTGKSFVSYKEWINYSSQKLIERLFQWPTMHKLIQTLQNPLSEESRQLLLSHFLPSNLPVKITVNQDKLARFLTAEGALINTEMDFTYEVPSSLIRNLLLNHLIRNIQLKTIPNEPIPFFNGGNQLNIFEVIKTSLKYFDNDTLTLSISNAYKGTRATGMQRGVNVPQEGIYHEQLYFILLLWLQKPTRNPNQKILVWSEANVPMKNQNQKSRRCDLLLEINKGKKYILEIMASDSNSEIKKHINDTIFYTNALNAQESWVIHFVATENFDKTKLIWPKSQDNVNLMYIFHDLNWKEAILFTQTNNQISETKMKFLQ